jgi:broad specificity phosphatase PhoE
MLRAYVVRHAQSQANKDARLSSAEPGPELTELGHRQARHVGESLADQGIEAIYSSPLRRTLATAEHIGTLLGIDVRVLPDLREFGLGDWEGRAGTDRDVADHPVFASWLRREALEQRFQGGESGHELEERVRRALAHVSAEVVSGSVVLVSHGGLMGVAIPLLVEQRAALGRIPANAETWTMTLDQGRWTVEAAEESEESSR